MEINTQEIFLLHHCSPEPCTLSQNPLSSSPSPPKIYIQFTRQTYTFTFDEPRDFLYSMREETDDPSMEPLCICVAAEEVDGDNGEFYLSVYNSLERIGILYEGLHNLATSVVKSICEVKSSNPDIKELVIKVIVTVANVVTVSDTSTAIESMEEYEEANYGMVPTSKKAKKRMLKNIIVAGEEKSPVIDRSDDRERKRIRRESIQEENCVICLEDFPVTSSATQLPCLHVFHNTCIEEWLEVSHFCPICRYELPAD